MDQIRRYAAEHETVEGIKTLTAHYQKSVSFRRMFQDRRRDRPLSLRAMPLIFSEANCCLAS